MGITIVDGHEDRQWKELNGVRYPTTTPDAVIVELDDARRAFRAIPHHASRLKITYGDSVTGEAWADAPVVGYVGNTMVPREPTLLHNRRSTGGYIIECPHIVRIEFANAQRGGVLYEHPTYHAH